MINQCSNLMQKIAELGYQLWQSDFITCSVFSSDTHYIEAGWLYVSYLLN